MSDASVFSFLFGLAHKNQFLDWFLVFLGKDLIFILGIVFVILVLREKDWRRRFYFSALALISVILSRGIITPLIQFYYDKPRPFTILDIQSLINHAATPSFPSGHITFIVPIALTVWFINRRVGIWFIISAILIGLARISAGIHWPSDILGGIVVGTLSFFAIYHLLKLKNRTTGDAGN